MAYSAITPHGGPTRLQKNGLRHNTQLLQFHIPSHSLQTLPILHPIGLTKAITITNPRCETSSRIRQLDNVIAQSQQLVLVTRYHPELLQLH